MREKEKEAVGSRKLQQKKKMRAIHKPMVKGRFMEAYR